MACEETLILKKGGEERHHFEYLTNIEQNGDIMEACLQTARLRWNMEDSFNDQKNRDFEMQHLFSRHSFRSFGNWYQILGPAHNIYQPAVKSADMNGLPGLHSKQTLRHIRQNLLSFISFAQADEIDAVNDCLSKARQVRMQT